MTIAGAAVFAGADWGTSNMRLWLFGANGSVVSERRSDEGMSALSGSSAFAAVLERHLDALGAPRDLPVVACGMVGARQGWIDAGYGELPARLDALAETAVRAPEARRDVRILSGLAQLDPPDVMHGEETKLAGASGAIGAGRRLVLMPGTHSKWARIEDGAITGFRTAMTGELFAVLGEASILRHSSDGAPADPQGAAFRSWVETGLSEAANLPSLLFRIRAAGLGGRLSASAAASALSGLLIGAEIAGAPGDMDVLLISGGALLPLYRAALQIADRSFEEIDADDAVRRGLFTAGRNLFLRGAVA